VVGRYDADCHLLVVESGTRGSRFPVEARIGIAWSNGLTGARAYWLDVTGSTVPADAWHAFQAGTSPP
jgi:hypothetical protein